MAGMPIFLLYKNNTDAAENDDTECPDGNENLPDGVPISREVSFSNAPDMLNGRSRPTMPFRSIVDRIKPRISDSSRASPVLRDFFKIRSINPVIIHIAPPLPRYVITGITASQKPLRICCILLSIKKSISVIKKSPLLLSIISYYSKIVNQLLQKRKKYSIIIYYMIIEEELV